MLKISPSSKRKTVIKTSRMIGGFVLLLGILLLSIAVVNSASVPALIGLGLFFWGVILMYIQTEEYVKKTFFDATASSLLAAINQTLKELGYEGRAIYLPPRYLNEVESSKLYLPKKAGIGLPSTEQTQMLEKQASQRNAQGMLITPPGAQITSLLEQSLGTSFIRTTLDDLARSLPKLLVEDLELAKDFRFEAPTETNQELALKTSETREKNPKMIFVRIVTDVYANTWKQIQQLSLIYGNIGCPLTSALALTIAKVTGQPIVINNQKTSNNGTTMETEYILLTGEN